MNQNHKSTAVQDVDFLPARFREEYARRKTRAWRIIVIAAFAAALPVASLYQYRMQLAHRRVLGAITQQFEQAQADSQRLAALQESLAEMTATAELYTWLNHSWPRTQLLAAVASSLPESITLEELEIFVEPFQTDRRPDKRSEQTSGDQQDEPRFRSARDRRALSEQFDGTTIVRIHGRTTNSHDLHAYLAELADSRFFIQADLDAIENRSTENSGRRSSQFEALLVVRPSYCEPNGPSAPTKQNGPDQVANSSGRDSL